MKKLSLLEIFQLPPEEQLPPQMILQRLAKYEQSYNHAHATISKGLMQYQQLMEALIRDPVMPSAVRNHAKAAIQTARLMLNQVEGIGDDLMVMASRVENGRPAPYDDDGNPQDQSFPRHERDTSGDF